MKFRMFGALLCGAALVLAATTGSFAGNPIGGVGVGIETSGNLATTKSGSKNQTMQKNGGTPANVKPRLGSPADSGRSDRLGKTRLGN